MRVRRVLSFAYSFIIKHEAVRRLYCRLFGVVWVWRSVALPMKNHFYKNLASLLSGNAIAQVIQLLGLVFFATVYAPSAFGILGTSQSIAVIVAALCTLQMNIMVPLAKDREEAVSLVNDARLTIFIFVFAMSPLILVWGNLFFVVLLLALVVSLNNVHCALVVFDEKFPSLSIFYLFRAALIVLFQYLLFLPLPENGLLWGSVVGELVACFVLVFISKGGLARVSGKGLWTKLVARRAYTLYGTLQELLTIAAYYMPLYIFQLKFGSHISGQYAFASRLVWGPLIVLTSSLSQVLIKFYAGEEGQRRFLSLHVNTVRYMFPIIFLCALVASLTWKVSSLIVGVEWGYASGMLGLSILWAGFFLLSMPYRVMLRVKGLQRLQLFVDLGGMALYGLVFIFFDYAVLATMGAFVVIAGVQNWLLSMIVLKQREANV